MYLLTYLLIAPARRALNGLGSRCHGRPAVSPSMTFYLAPDVRVTIQFVGVRVWEPAVHRRGVRGTQVCYSHVTY